MDSVYGVGLTGSNWTDYWIELNWIELTRKILLPWNSHISLISVYLSIYRVSSFAPPKIFHLYELPCHVVLFHAILVPSLVLLCNWEEKPMPKFWYSALQCATLRCAQCAKSLVPLLDRGCFLSRYDWSNVFIRWLLSYFCSFSSSSSSCLITHYHYRRHHHDHHHGHHRHQRHFARCSSVLFSTPSCAVPVTTPTCPTTTIIIVHTLSAYIRINTLVATVQCGIGRSPRVR